MRRARSVSVLGAALIVALVPAGLMAAQQTSWTEPNWTGGAALLNVTPSARQAGMGNVGLCGGDVMRAWSNPALLGDLAGTGEIAIGGGSMMAGEESMFNFAGAWRTSPAFTLGLLVSRNTVSFEPDYDGMGPSGDAIAQEVGAYGIAAGIKAAGWLRLGLTGKMVSEKLIDDQATSFAVDAGAVATFSGFSIGASGRNIGPDLRQGRCGLDCHTACRRTSWDLDWRPWCRAAVWRRFSGRGWSGGLPRPWRCVRGLRISAGVRAGRRT